MRHGAQRREARRGRSITARRSFARGAARTRHAQLSARSPIPRVSISRNGDKRTGCWRNRQQKRIYEPPRNVMSRLCSWHALTSPRPPFSRGKSQRFTNAAFVEPPACKPYWRMCGHFCRVLCRTASCCSDAQHYNLDLHRVLPVEPLARFNVAY